MSIHLNNAKDLLPATVDKLSTTLSVALGNASGCWDNLAGAGVFESERCTNIAEDLLDDVVMLTGLGEPSLGLATSRQLLVELAARLDPSLHEDGDRLLKAIADCLEGGPDYRTVTDGA